MVGLSRRLLALVSGGVSSGSCKVGVRVSVYGPVIVGQQWDLSSLLKREGQGNDTQKSLYSFLPKNG